MKLFLLGSLAFDELGHFNGLFEDLLKGGHLDRLSISFGVEDVRESFGGCAGNVAYGLSLLSTPATVCGILGVDGQIYKELMKAWGMDVNFTERSELKTAKATITSDLEGAQIMQFNRGAMNSKIPFKLPDTAEAGDLFLIGPEDPSRMLEAATQAKAKGLRVFLDPGQNLHVFSAQELLDLLSGAEAFLANEYEWELFKAKTGLDETQVLKTLPVLILTQAEHGVRLHQENTLLQIPAFPAQFLDGTGAGDAFRAGLLAGLLNGEPYGRSTEIGVVLGSACVENPFAQGYPLTPDRVLALKKLGWPESKLQH